MVHMQHQYLPELLSQSKYNRLTQFNVLCKVIYPQNIGHLHKYNVLSLKQIALKCVNAPEMGSRKAKRDESNASVVFVYFGHSSEKRNLCVILKLCEAVYSVTSFYSS